MYNYRVNLGGISVSMSGTSGANVIINGVPVQNMAARYAPLREVDHNRVVHRSSSHSAKPSSGYVAPRPAARPTHVAPTPAPAPVATSSALPPRKRKSEALEQETDPVAAKPWNRLDFERCVTRNGGCDAIRMLIREHLDLKGMKVCDFQRAIGVSSSAYNNFMRKNGHSDGQGTATYMNSKDYFFNLWYNEPDHDGPGEATTTNVAKRAKRDDTAVVDLDVSHIMLPDEEYGCVPVFDTCRDLRRKLRALLGKPGVIRGDVCRELTKMVAHEGRNIRYDSLAKFMEQKGVSGGSSSIVYYAAYVYFEKMRIRDGKPKSNMRLDMEDVWGEDGVTMPREGRPPKYWCRKGDQPYEDKYGRVHFARA